MHARVRSVRDVAVDVREYELDSADGVVFPSAEPGAHIDVTCPNGMVRQYSLIAYSGGSEGYTIAVQKDPASRGGSESMHRDVEPGSRLVISEPKNNFRLDGSARRALFLAGGIGVTPLYSMIRARRSAGHDDRFVYFGRAADRMAYLDDIRGISSEADFLAVIGAEPDRVRAAIEDEAREIGDDAAVYLCGPSPMMDAAVEVLSEFVAPDAIRQERFSADAAADATGGFDIVLHRSGQTVRVDEGETIVEALSRSGVDVPTSCEQGVCGTCVTAVLEGEPDHRDMFLTEEEQERGDQMCLCVSGSRSAKLVLDL